MDQERSLRLDVADALVAFLTGCLAGLLISVPVGLVVFLVAGAACTGDSMCDLGAAFFGLVVGLGVAVLVFATSAIRSLRRNCPQGQRWRAGLLVFLWTPLFLLLLLSASGLG